MTTNKLFRPRQLFTAEEWSRLTAPVSWQGFVLIGHAWAVVAAVMLAVVLSGYHPLVILLGVPIVGARQLGFGILMHEAAHGMLHRNKKINDLLGQWFSAAPTGSDLNWYRPYHLSHHRHVQTEDDPDLPLSAPFPVSKQSLRRKILRDLTGQTFFKQRAFAVIGAYFRRDMVTTPGAEVIASQSGMNRFLLTNAALLGVLIALGHGWLYLWCWLLPLATWNPLATRIRNIAEHACVESDHSEPLSQARTTHTSFLERITLAPYWVAYHAEHHAMMYVPCFRLPIAHRMLKEKGALGRTDLQPGYLSVLRKVTALPA
jgi:fatty acid desaturase